METLGLVSGLATLLVTYKLFFRDMHELFDSIKFWLTPDIISLFRGEYLEDTWAEWKLIAWLGSGFVMGYLITHF